MKCRWCGIVFANYYESDGDICSDACRDSETLAAEAMTRLDAMPTNPPKSKGFFRGPLELPVTHEWDDDAGFVCATGAEVTPDVIDELLGATFDGLTISVDVTPRVCDTCNGRGSVKSYGSDPMEYVRRDRACPDCVKVGPGIRSGKVRE